MKFQKSDLTPHNHRVAIATGILVFLIYAVPVRAAELDGPPAENAHSTRTVTLTLEECVTKAIHNSDQLAAERSRLDALDAQRKSILWEPFSQFYIQGKFAVVPDNCADITNGQLMGCNGSNTVSADEDYDSGWGPSFHFKIGGALPIPTSGKMSYGKTALEEGIKAKQAMLPSFQNEIRYNVHRSFHAIIGAREMLYTLSEGRKHIEKARRKIEENLEKQEGTETEIDLVKLKVFEAQLDAMEQEAILIEKQGLAALNFLVKLPNGKAVDIPEDAQKIVDGELKTIDDYKQQAIDNRPELDALHHAVKAYNAKVQLQRTDFVPDLAFVVSLRQGYTPGVKVQRDANAGTGRPTRYEDASVPFLYEDSYNYGSFIPTVGLVLSYPLDFGKDVNRLKQAKAELTAMVLDQKQAINGILLEVEMAYIELESTKASIDALNRSKRLARGWMLAAIQNQATGIGNSKEVKDALKEYFGVMAQLHQKIAAYNIGVAKLEKVTGINPAQSKNK